MSGGGKQQTLKTSKRKHNSSNQDNHLATEPNLVFEHDNNVEYDNEEERYHKRRLLDPEFTAETQPLQAEPSDESVIPPEDDDVGVEVQQQQPREDIDPTVPVAVAVAVESTSAEEVTLPSPLPIVTASAVEEEPPQQQQVVKPKRKPFYTIKETHGQLHTMLFKSRTNDNGSIGSRIVDPNTMLNALFKVDGMVVMYDSYPSVYNANKGSNGGGSGAGNGSGEPGAEEGRLTWRLVCKAKNVEIHEDLTKFDNELIPLTPLSIEAQPNRRNQLDMLMKHAYGRRTKLDGSLSDDADMQFDVPFNGETGYATIIIRDEMNQTRRDICKINKGTICDVLFNARFFRVSATNIGVKLEAVQIKFQEVPINLQEEVLV